MHIRVENPEWEKLVSKIQQEQELVKLENTNGEFDEETVRLWDGLVGTEIQEAKRKVLRVINYFDGVKKEREEKERQGKKVSADDFSYLNMLLFGAPGTGKTTIAILIGKLMHAKGILPSSTVHVVSAGMLSRGYVRGVQENLLKEAEKAVGGVLIIDDIGTIEGEYQGGNFAVDFTRGLVSVIDKYRGNMCVILCGYEEEVLRIIKYDVGAERKFPKKIKFVSYSIDALMVILNKLLEADNKSLENGVLEILRKIILADMKAQGKAFGNVGYLKEELLTPIKAAYFERGQLDNIYTIEDINTAFPNKINATSEKDEDDKVMPYFEWVYNPIYNEAKRRAEQLAQKQHHTYEKTTISKEDLDIINKRLRSAIEANNEKLRKEIEASSKESTTINPMTIFGEAIRDFGKNICAIMEEYCNSSDYCENNDIRSVATNYCELLNSLLSGFDKRLSGTIETLELENALTFAKSDLLNGDYEACIGICQTYIPRTIILYILDKF